MRLGTQRRSDRWLAEKFDGLAPLPYRRSWLVRLFRWYFPQETD